MGKVLAAGVRAAVLATALLAAPLAGPAGAQTGSAAWGGAPEWSRSLIGADMAPPVRGSGLSVRLTIAPADGGVARLIRYEAAADGAGRIGLLRFTGHPRNGWSQWGGDGPARLAVTAEGAGELNRLVRAALRAATVTNEPRQAGPAVCVSGALAFLEISDGGAQAAFERRCVTEGPAAAAIAAISTAAGSQTEEELRAAGIEELMNADRAFNALAQSRGAPAAFVEFAHDDVVLFRQGFPPYRGKDGVRARFAGWPAGAKLSWAPEAAEVSARGDMGWIWGRGDYVAPDGKRSTSLYVSVWRRDLDGAWRYVTDIGVEGPAVAPGAGGDLRR